MQRNPIILESSGQCCIGGIKDGARSPITKSFDKPIQEVIVEMTDGGVDYSFEMDGEFKLDTFITHTMGLEDINDAFDLMHEGKSIRTVIHYDK